MANPFQSACRLCGGTHLTPAFTLEQQNAWVFCGDASGDGGCGLLQRGTVSPDDPRGPVPLLSWTEQHRRRSVVAGALEMMSTRQGFALDIGCGDGSLLAAFPRWITPVGVDTRMPTTGAKDWGIGLHTPFLSDDTQEALDEIAEHGFDIVTAIGFLETSNEPGKVLSRIKDNLAADGIAVIETSYAALALTRTLASPFNSDSRTVWSLATIEHVARAAGLRIVRGQMTERAAGSIRLYMVHEGYQGQDYQPWLDMLARLWDEEAALSLRGRQAYDAYAARLETRLVDIAQVRDEMILADEHAYILGTCAATFALMSAADLGYDVISAHVGDRPSDGFPEIITHEDAAAAPPDVLIAPAWRRRESLEQWYDQIMGGMRLMFLEPELLIVDRHNYAAELGRALAVTDGPGSVETLRAALTAMRGPGLRLVADSRAS